MRIHDLIKKLESLPQDKEIMILDGFNGGGNPREINFAVHSMSPVLMARADGPSIDESSRLLSAGDDNPEFKAAMEEIDAYLEEHKV